MKKFILFLLLLILALNLQGQKDTLRYAASQGYLRESTETRVNIYPVPVVNNNFTIKTDKDISSVRVTNIIGQDIYRIRFNNPQQIIKVTLDTPQRGMYLVTIIFTDGLRIVKKILIEESE